MGYIGFAKPTPMKVIPSGLHMIGKACTYKGIPKLGYIGLAKPVPYESQPNWVLMKANPIGLHGIWKAWVYER